MRFTNKIPSVIALFLLTVPLLARTYSTTFPATENPISEGGNWTSGSAAGTCNGHPCYYDMRTTSDSAFGTMPSPPPGANDSTAILTGTWGLNQTVTAVAHIPNYAAGELEIRLRSSLAPGGLSYGYEVNFAQGYCQIVRWNGAVAANGDYTFLFNPLPLQPCAKVPVEGSTIVASAVSSGSGSTVTITAWVDGKQVMSVVDSGQGGKPAINDSFCSTHTCNPGMGTFVNSGGSSSGFGFSKYTAADSGSVVEPPTGLTGVVK